MIAGALLRAGGGALVGFASGVLIGGRLGLWVSPGGEHEWLSFLFRWGLPFALAPAGFLGAVLLILSGATTRMAKGLIGSVAGSGDREERLVAAGLLGHQLNRTLGRPVLMMRLVGGGLLLALILGSAASILA